jgi:hypothetical protein
LIAGEGGIRIPLIGSWLAFTGCTGAWFISPFVDATEPRDPNTQGSYGQSKLMWLFSSFRPTFFGTQSAFSFAAGKKSQ